MNSAIRAAMIAGAGAMALLLAPAAVAAPAKPGTLANIAPLAAANSLSGAARAYRILYASTDGVKGEGSVQVSGAVFIPAGAAPAGGWPVVAWAHGTVGIGDGCAPSANPRSERDTIYLNSWLAAGYAVVATDYQGLGTPGPHPYLNVRSEAYSVLDSVRAALAADLGLANKILLVGQSQGGGAAFGTAGYATAYAPDLKVLGTVATGVPYLADGISTDGDADAVDRTIAYLMYIASAAGELDPGLKADTVFTQAAMPLVKEAATRCVGDMMQRVVKAGLTRGNALRGDFTAYYGPYLRGAGYATLKIDTPVFIGTGAEDVDVPPAMQRALVNAACKAGTAIQFHEYPGRDHSGAVNRSFLDSRVFAARLLKGEDVSFSCTTPD